MYGLVKSYDQILSAQDYLCNKCGLNKLGGSLQRTRRLLHEFEPFYNQGLI